MKRGASPLARGNVAAAREVALDPIDVLGILIAYRLGAGEPALLLRASQLPRSSARETPRVWLVVLDARAAAERLASAGIAPLARSSPAGSWK